MALESLRANEFSFFCRLNWRKRRGRGGWRLLSSWKDLVRGENREGGAHGNSKWVSPET